MGLINNKDETSTDQEARGRWGDEERKKHS